MEWLTIAAIVVGPIAAVLVTRFNDERKAARLRQRDVFAALMRTRMQRLAAEHIFTLNLVQVEFHGVSKVLEAHKTYIDSLNSGLPTDDDGQRRTLAAQSDQFIDLVHQMALYLNYKFDKRDLERHAYSPVGWVNDEEEIRKIRRGLLNVLSGSTPLPMYQMGPPTKPTGPFPPAPPSQDPN